MHVPTAESWLAMNCSRHGSIATTTGNHGHRYEMIRSRAPQPCPSTADSSSPTAVRPSSACGGGRAVESTWPGTNPPATRPPCLAQRHAYQFAMEGFPMCARRRRHVLHAATAQRLQGALPHLPLSAAPPRSLGRLLGRSLPRCSCPGGSPQHHVFPSLCLPVHTTQSPVRVAATAGD